MLISFSLLLRFATIYLFVNICSQVIFLIFCKIKKKMNEENRNMIIEKESRKEIIRVR